MTAADPSFASRHIGPSPRDRARMLELLGHGVQRLVSGDARELPRTLGPAALERVLQAEESLKAGTIIDENW